MTPPYTDKKHKGYVQYCFLIKILPSQTSLHLTTEALFCDLDTTTTALSNCRLYATAPHKQQKHRRDFLRSLWPDFLNLFLCSQGSIHLTIELYCLVYHFPHTREQKQLKAKREAVYNMSGAVGAPAVSCLCPGSSKIVLAAEGNKWVWKWGLWIVCVLAAEASTDI